MELNPSGLPVEVYIPETRLWELFVDDQASVTFAPATREILISLRPSYLQGFKVKPGLSEILDLQLHQGSLGPKRAAVEELVSPRSLKIPRHLDPPRIGSSSPSTTKSTPSRLDFNFEDASPTSLSLTPPPQSHASLSPPDTTPGLPNTVSPNPVRAKERNLTGFRPSPWPAHAVLEKTSEYLVRRSGKCGSYSKIFKQVFGLEKYPRTTAILVTDLYPAAYNHFRSLGYGEQSTITWSDLIHRFGITKMSSDGMPFIPFTRPVPPSSEHSTSQFRQISQPTSPEDQLLHSSLPPETHTLRLPLSDASRLDDGTFHPHSLSGLRGGHYVHSSERYLVRTIEPCVVRCLRVLSEHDQGFGLSV